RCRNSPIAHSSGNSKRLFVQRFFSLVVALRRCHVREIPERRGETLLIAYFSPEYEAFFIILGCLTVVSTFFRYDSQVIEGNANPMFVSNSTEYFQSFVVHRDCSGVVILIIQDDSELVQSATKTEPIWSLAPK